MAKGHFVDVQMQVNGKDGTQAIGKMVRIMEQGYSNQKDAFEGFIGKLMKFIERGFDSGRIGHKWTKLAPSTVAYKKKYYPSVANKILVRTGALEHSLTKRGSTNQILKITKKEMTFGTEGVGYYHHTGPKTKSGTKWKLPRRQIMPGVEYSKDKDIIAAMTNYQFGIARTSLQRTGGRTR